MEIGEYTAGGGSLDLLQVHTGDSDQFNPGRFYAYHDTVNDLYQWTWSTPEHSSYDNSYVVIQTGRAAAPASSQIRLITNDLVFTNTSLVELFRPNSAWTTYTPSWSSSGTQPSLGNGAITGRYFRIGKAVFVYIKLDMGSTTTYGTGSYYFSVPFTQTDSGMSARRLGQMSVYDANTAQAGWGWVRTHSSTQVVCEYISGAGMMNAIGVVGTTTPVTFANGDRLDLWFVMEVA
jgi:hypothetical protein